MSDVVRVSWMAAAGAEPVLIKLWDDGLLVVRPCDVKFLDHRMDGWGQLELHNGERYVTRIPFAELKALLTAPDAPELGAV